MTRLARDVRGNTLAIMTASLIPLIGMIGGGLDIGRMYILKTRLQGACDAGALAGRKAMGGGVWSQNGNYPNSVALRFFDNNFKDGSFGSSDRTRTFTEKAGKVTGTAQAKIPMTLMRVFKQPTRTISVSCDAEMRLPNTDVMFVLDTTGSMGGSAGGGQTRIEALRVAVKCFYEIVARLDTNAACTTGTPSGGTGGQVQIRFGFVPYATNVNVGRLLPTQWFADSWKYQTRELAGMTWSGWTTYDTKSSTKNGTCAATPSNTSTTEYRSRHEKSGSNWYCYFDRRDKNVPIWNYDLLPVNTSLLKSGSGVNWRSSFQWPIANDGGDKTINWDGCIEERATVRQTSYDPIPSGARDLDIDLVPNSNVDTQWGPALRDVISTRNWSYAAINNTTTNYGSSANYSCPTEARLLQAWPDPGQFDAYVDGLTPSGNTYHDIGLLWGARLISPTGLFAADNATTPQGGEIERHLIFMTDGVTETIPSYYQAYGVARLDRRQTNPSVEPTSTDLNNQVNARFLALCTAVRNKNITLWVIGFGSLDTTTTNRLTACASPGRYFPATNGAALQATFKNIADQISMLRLTS